MWPVLMSKFRSIPRRYLMNPSLLMNHMTRRYPLLEHPVVLLKVNHSSKDRILTLKSNRVGPLLQTQRRPLALHFLGEAFGLLHFALVLCVECYKTTFLWSIWVVFPEGATLGRLFLTGSGNVEKLLIRSGKKHSLRICETMLDTCATGKVPGVGFATQFTSLFSWYLLWLFCHVSCGYLMHFL